MKMSAESLERFARFIELLAEIEADTKEEV